MTEPTRDDRDYLDAIARKLGDPDAYVRFLEEKLARAAVRAAAEPSPIESGVRPIEDAQPEQSSTGTHVPLSADGAS
ncbi:MAG: hypothetical protein KF729_10810 [Sandaracinaceae bacterium]|nr:hypothetical protein [Sandaracinaceae bacterium]